MKRPAILDEDVVVVPSRPIAWFVKDFADGWIYFDNNADANLQINATGAISLAGFSASPHATEWAEVKAYVEWLEKRLSQSPMDGNIEAAEARIAELEARLKEAARVIAPFVERIREIEQSQILAKYSIATNIDVAHLRTARTWMEGMK